MIFLAISGQKMNAGKMLWSLFRYAIYLRKNEVVNFIDLGFVSTNPDPS
jgi:hypothetical protein